MFSKFEWTYVTLSKSFNLSFAAFSASASWSIPINLPVPLSLLRISVECPAPPKVQSTYTPFSFTFNPSTVSFNMTE